jgi:amino acid adenylation domain-containing protein/non-ribosomal peptide synthase protein (TIGR01720 family)
MSEEIVHGYRLSPQQKRLWSLQRGVFWSRCAVRIAGRIDGLEKAIYRVVEEHEILRTTFTMLPGMTVPVQVIHPESPGCIQRHDLTRLSKAEQQRQVSDLYSTTTDLDVLPLFRCDLLELSHDEAMMLLRAPVICADLRSLENIVSQIVSIYAGETTPLDAMQYADFAEWHHELLESEEGRKYSTTQSSPAEVNLPFETRANEDAVFQPQVMPVSLSVDPQGVVLACWQTLIQRLAGASKITLGSACDGRRHPELVNSVGPYSRYVPLQIESNDELTITELSNRLAEAKKQAAEWQEYFTWPDAESYFSVCFEERRDQTGSNNFSIYQRDAVEDRFKLKLVTCTRSVPPAVAGGSVSNQDRALLTHPPATAGGTDRSHARLELHYDAARFASDDIRRMADELATLIASAIRAPSAPIRELESLSNEERSRIVEGFNQTSEAFPEECIHHSFEIQARQTPDTVAVVCGSDKLTYSELNQRANQLARYLQKLGVGPDVPVGLCLERSTDFVICLLAVMKAGGAYLPLDVNTPHERLATMLADTRTPVLITRDDRAFDGCRTLSLDLIASELATEEAHDFTSDVTPANLAYVIFTSGSTGRPKGVAVEHRELCNYVHAIDRRVGLSSCRSFAIVSTLVADLAHTMLFPSLLTGGTLHLIGEDQATSPDLLAHYFNQNPIDCLKIVPTHLNALLTSTHATQLLPRRHLILGGEACPRSLVEKINEVATGISVWNHYGPTETTVGCVAQQLTLNDTSTIAIGKPLSNNTAYVLNERLRPVPIGVTGELYVGGEGVARGYLNRPELTAERFIPDPFSKDPGRRFYATGDRARYLSDGRIEILGRVDHQLKVRGYRIEPEEIQLALNAHPLVSQSVVTGREDRGTDKRLVAYVVAADSTQPAVKDLREFLGRRLPDYMVPSSFVFLKTLPLTPNGKIDRDALPQPQADGGEKQFVGPRTPVEAELSRIWTTVLGLQQVSINDNFFELGGDSILAIQIIARANQAGMNLEPRQIFQHQTIAELAAVANDGLRAEAEQEMITGEVPLSPVQARFFELSLPDPHYYNQARLLKLSQPLDSEFLRNAVEHVLLHHDALRLRFFYSGEKWTQINGAPEAAVPFERIDISNESEVDDVLRSHAARIHASLNLQEGPIIRVALFDGPASYLLIVVHHLAVDTISWGVLLEDLETAYHQLAASEEVSLPRKTTSFKSWTEQLAQFAQSSSIEPEIDYWAARAVTKLAVDHAGANTVASRRTISVSLTPAETRSVLQDLPAKHRTQINEVLLAALARAFTAWTKTPSFLIDLEGHGREQIIEGVDLARTVGWFTSIFPVVLDLGKSSKPLEALRAVKDQLRAVPNRGIGYGLLRYSSGRKEVVDRLSRLPQAEVRFNYLGQQDRSLSSSRLFVSAHDSGAEAQSLRGERAYLLNIIASVSDGQLRFNWTYSENVHARETIERLAETTLAELRALLKEDETSVYAPSDFPKAKLTQKDLNKILAKLRT